MSEANRARQDLERAVKARAQHEKAISTKSAELVRKQAALAKAEGAERKKQEKSAQQAEAARELRVAELEEQLRVQQHTRLEAAIPDVVDGDDQECDCFISHASEDKEGFVRPLAEALQARGLTIFYDEFSIEWGASLRRRIDEGLKRSKFGVVVLSEAFFRKEWPKKELDGLVQMEMSKGTIILPLWHKVTKDEIAAFSPMLADKAALSTTDFTIAEIVEKLAKLSGK